MSKYYFSIFCGLMLWSITVAAQNFMPSFGASSPKAPKSSNGNVVPAADFQKSLLDTTQQNATKYKKEFNANVEATVKALKDIKSPTLPTEAPTTTPTQPEEKPQAAPPQQPAAPTRQPSLPAREPPPSPPPPAATEQPPQQSNPPYTGFQGTTPPSGQAPTQQQQQPSNSGGGWNIKY